MSNFTLDELLEFGDWCRNGLTNLEYSTLLKEDGLYREWKKRKKHFKLKEGLEQAKMWSAVEPGDVLAVISKNSRAKIELGEKVVVKKINQSTRRLQNESAQVYDVLLQRTLKSSVKSIKISAWSDGELINDGWKFEKLKSK